MFRSHALWFFPVAISLGGFGLGAFPATAQTTYNFSANYTGTAETRFITPDITEGVAETESTDAPFGLTQAQDLRYAQLVDAATGAFIYDSEPKRFGLQDKPNGFFLLFGIGSDKLFGTLSGTGVIDFGNLTQTFSGPVTITGGEGRFSGANGTLFLSGSNIFSLNSTGILSRGGFSLNGSFTTATTVPEPSTLPALVGLGMSGASVLLSRHIRRWVRFCSIT
jgi:hypothetical protein